MIPVEFDGTWFDKDHLQAIGPVVDDVYSIPQYYFEVKLCFGTRLCFGHDHDKREVQKMHKRFIEKFFTEPTPE